MNVVVDILLDAVVDTLLLVPFLLITYLVMEWIEHKTSDAILNSVGTAGASGPVVGAVLGVVPQCGFSAATATLYSARMVTVGTLVAVFLSTSDEMLPLFIAEGLPAPTVLGILGVKLGIAVVAGLLTDAVARRLRVAQHKPDIHKLCEDANCYCEERCEGADIRELKERADAGAGHVHEPHDAHECAHEHGHGSIVKSALKHTVQVTVFVFVITLALNALFALVGDEAIAAALGANRWLAILACTVVGLIPNCAASVAIAQLFVEGVITTGACLAGLLPAAGVGILVLLRTNKGNAKESWAILGLLAAIGVVCGFAIDALGIVF